LLRNAQKRDKKTRTKQPREKKRKKRTKKKPTLFCDEPSAQMDFFEFLFSVFLNSLLNFKGLFAKRPKQRVKKIDEKIKIKIKI
jgi:hypothetical protein